MAIVFDPFTGQIINVGAGGGGGGGGSVAGNIRVSFKNNTGSTITFGTPVCLNSSGELKLVNVASDADAETFIGLASENIANGDSGAIMTVGKLVEVTTSIPVGSGIWVSKFGGITEIAPDVGVNGFVVGDWVIKIGMVAKNLTNPANKDIIIVTTTRGQL